MQSQAPRNFINRTIVERQPSYEFDRPAGIIVGKKKNAWMNVTEDREKNEALNSNANNVLISHTNSRTNIFELTLVV